MCHAQEQRYSKIMFQKHTWQPILITDDSSVISIKARSVNKNREQLPQQYWICIFSYYTNSYITYRFYIIINKHMHCTTLKYKMIG